MKKKRHALRIALVALVVLTLAAGAAVLYKNGWFERIGSVEELRALIASRGALGGVVYFLLQMMTVIIAPIPSNVTMMAGALALGFWRALLLGVAAVVLGSVIMFLLARRLGREAVRRFLDRGVMDRYLPIIEEKQDMFLFLTMLFPFFPDDALCILAGLKEIPLRRFVIIMAAARPWGLAFAALLGSGAIQMPALAWAVLVIVLAAVFCLAMAYSARIEAALLRLVTRLTGRRGGKQP